MDSEFAAGEDTAFVNDEISSIIKEAIGNFCCSSFFNECYVMFAEIFHTGTFCIKFHAGRSLE